MTVGSLFHSDKSTKPNKDESMWRGSRSKCTSIGKAGALVVPGRKNSGSRSEHHRPRSDDRHDRGEPEPAHDARRPGGRPSRVQVVSENESIEAALGMIRGGVFSGLPVVDAQGPRRPGIVWMTCHSAVRRRTRLHQPVAPAPDPAVRKHRRDVIGRRRFRERYRARPPVFAGKARAGPLECTETPPVLVRERYGESPPVFAGKTGGSPPFFAQTRKCISSFVSGTALHRRYSRAKPAEPPRSAQMYRNAQPISSLVSGAAR